MLSVAELCRKHTDLDPGAVDHLERLVAAWELVADLGFADLLLFARRAGCDDELVVLAQVRPTTTQTLYHDDWVGRVVPAAQRPLVAEALRRGEAAEGDAVDDAGSLPVQEMAIPVGFRGDTVAVVARASAFGRQPGTLERIYLGIFATLAAMIAAGDYPFGVVSDVPPEEAPRVGDGVVLVDRSGRVDYASPNAVSTFHRVGVGVNATGRTLGELGLDDRPVQEAMRLSTPVTEELEPGPAVTVLVRCIPLLHDGRRAGAVVLLRDVSELRRRDRLLVSKDATIREIHHRVKNNLQTISSLLRLQGRRLRSAEAKEVVEESVRRIRAIAVVHEILSRDAVDDAPFGEIVRSLARLAEEGLGSAERPVVFTVEGEGCRLPARLATPLAVVVNELLQNAVEHAFPDRWWEAEDLGGSGAAPEGCDEGPGEGHLVVRLVTDDDALAVTVADDGVGLPEGFALPHASGLGLSIVRTLVASELSGSITVRAGSGDDAAELGLDPLRPGTVVELRVPLAAEA